VSPGHTCDIPGDRHPRGGRVRMAPKTSPETLLVATVSEEHKDRGVPGAHLRHPRRPSSTRGRRTEWPPKTSPETLLVATVSERA